MYYRKTSVSLSFIFSLLLFSSQANAQSGGRKEWDLSGKGWNLWLDRAALWYDDSLYLPPVNVAQVPVNPPTIGFDGLHAGGGSPVSVPGTVEEKYWGKIGGAIPDTGGNYVGVSWWSRTFPVDAGLKGKRITLCFQSVNMRAEVFVNGTLVGYDVIGNTPFEVDATKAIAFGASNRLDIRITDPVGNFEWNDNILMRWGKNLIPAVHGFGGITGSVVLRSADPVSVEDIYVQNQTEPKRVKVFVTVANHTGSPQNGQLTLSLAEKGHPGSVIWTKAQPVTGLNGSQIFSFDANVPAAKLWSLAENGTAGLASLYEAQASFTGADGKIMDAAMQRFGFRWFDVEDKNQDPRFYLNGKRVFLIAAMTRGFWPRNGIFPTPAMAARDLKMMQELGMNMMLMHRAIGQPAVIRYADSAGLLTYEEPGGYRIMPNKADAIDAQDAQSRQLRQEKLKRMILRDRSLPSMIIYNLKNEETVAPNEYDIADMKMVHQLDPSRIITYNSGSDIGQDYHKLIPNNPFKLHMYPYNPELLYDGWWDQHHWVGQSGYVDEDYRNPRFYLRGVVNSPRSTPLDDSLHRLNKKELLFFGEEGAFGAIIRLQKIKEELDSTGATGFREQEHLDYYNEYNRFLDETGFRSSYPDVDSLTRSLGRNLHYFHGRNIENVRMGNIGDAYNVNGWASAATRTDVVDMYRNPTADPSIIRFYTRPLYLAVKLRNKVIPAGTTTMADLYIINEKDIKGRHNLKLTLTDPSGGVLLAKQYSVDIKGGEEFGQLLVEAIALPVLTGAGYYTVHASLEAGTVQTTEGSDQVYVVQENAHPDRKPACLVLEKDPVVAGFLQQARGLTAGAYSAAASKADVIVLGNISSAELTPVLLNDLLQRVREGAKLIVLEHADIVAQAIDDRLRDKPPVYLGGGMVRWGGSGRLFVGKSPLLDGLPVSQGMSWEYQCFYKTDDAGGNGVSSGIRLNHSRSEWVAALGHQGKKDILAALVRVPLGKGSVVLSTLSIVPNLATTELSSVVAKRLFLNLLD